MLKEHISGFLKVLQRERVLALFLALTLLVFLGGLGYFLAEESKGPWLPHLGMGIWWAMVTLTTVGYGDVVPVTTMGRLVGVALMMGGLVSISLLTATIASVFVQRKFRRERGLEAIDAKQHVLILGWRYDTEVLLRQLLHRLPPGVPVVLINRLPPEELEALRDRFARSPLFFVCGDFSREETLLKANVMQAERAIILGERQPAETAAQVDQRTLMTALTLKSLQPKLRVTAELLRQENRSYLERAGVEDILIRGQYDSPLLARAIATPGLFRVITSLLTGEGQTLWALEVPSRFHGRAVKELAALLKERHQALLLAIYIEGQALRLEELLSTEPSEIDNFIRRKFEEKGLTHLFGRAKVEFFLNPPDSHILGPHQYAVVLATQRPLL